MVGGNLVKNLIKTIFGSSQHGYSVDQNGWALGTAIRARVGWLGQGASRDGAAWAFRARSLGKATRVGGLARARGWGVGAAGLCGCVRHD